MSALLDDAFLLPPTVGFECGERVLDNEKQDDDAEHCDTAPPLPVTFFCSFSTRNNGHREPAAKSSGTLITRHELYFGCRRPSFGVLEGKEETVNDDGDNDDDTGGCLFDESAGDPNFFDKSYTLAGSTGFCVWAGARFMLDALVVASSTSATPAGRIPGSCSSHQHAHEPPTLTTWQQQITKGGARVLELGAGVGLLGTGLAAAGAQVLMTDLPSLVEDAIKPNLRRNARKKNVANNAKEPYDDDDDETSSSPPEWLLACAKEGQENDGGAESSSSHHDHVHRIGKGWAAAMPLDWSKPLDTQISNKNPSGQEEVQLLQDLDLIVASDCIWLTSLLDSLFDTVAAIFAKRSNGETATARTSPPTLLLAFQRRDQNVGSAIFTTVERMVQVMEERYQWKVSTIAWRPVTLVDGTETDVRVVQIQP